MVEWIANDDMITYKDYKRHYRPIDIRNMPKQCLVMSQVSIFSKHVKVVKFLLTISWQ